MRAKSSIEQVREAEEFIRQYYAENELPGVEERWQAVKASLEDKGTYAHSTAELEYGAKLAWRNSNRCIGRLFWKTLKVLDCRTTSDEVGFRARLQEHLALADRQNKIRSVISIFPPADPQDAPPVFDIKNYTLLMYAGYRTKTGVIGDPANIAFTNHCRSLGWRGEGTAFDLLPVVYALNGGPDRYFSFPSELVTEVNIEHPDYDWFAVLGLRWYKLPIIGSMRLDIGGIVYPAAPFNGWYMLDEVATRNFGDQHRYNVLPRIAKRMGLNINSPFWKEKSLLVLNEAVYYSYEKAGARIVDHHTAVRQFMQFMEQENDQGREVTGDWTWLIPPTASSTTAIFHREIKNETKLPNYFSAE